MSLFKSGDPVIYETIDGRRLDAVVLSKSDDDGDYLVEFCKPNLEPPTLYVPARKLKYRPSWVPSVGSNPSTTTMSSVNSSDTLNNFVINQDTCRHTNTYDNIISSNLKFRVCRDCKKDLGDI